MLPFAVGPRRASPSLGSAEPAGSVSALRGRDDEGDFERQTWGEAAERFCHAGQEKIRAYRKKIRMALQNKKKKVGEGPGWALGSCAGWWPHTLW